MAADSDIVVASAPIPQGGSLVGVSGELHMIGVEGASIQQISSYGFGGEVVPVVDPEATVNVEALWDTLVPKAIDPTIVAATTVIDVDWDDQDTTPQIEQGEVEMNQLLGIAEVNKQIFTPRLEYMSWANSPQGGWVAGTPDVWNPSDFKTFASSRKINADLPSYAMLAVTSPLTDDEETSESTISGAQEWAMLENLRSIMEDMWRINVGLVEAGAESPYAEVSALIEELVAPSIIQPAAAKLIAQTYTVFCRARWIIDMPDSSVPRVLKAY